MHEPRPQRRTTLALLLVALVAAMTPFAGAGSGAAAAQPRSAAPSRASVTVTAGVDGVIMHGTARSPRAGCLKERQVRIMHQVGTRGGGDDEFFHAEMIVMKSRHSGTWRLGFVLPPGKYYGVLQRDAECRRGASDTVWVPPTKIAGRAARAVVTATIAAAGTDLSGSVRSSRAACLQDRTVLVFRQRGARGGGDDERFASDVSFWGGGRTANWSIGNTGTEGRFYARVGRTPECRRATSPTVTARR